MIHDRIPIEVVRLTTGIGGELHEFNQYPT